MITNEHKKKSLTIRLYLLITVILCLFQISLIAQTGPVRLKDIGKIIEARDNQLMGFGLVVGLKNTGDTRSTGFTHLALRNLLGKMGVAAGIDFNSRNVAAVMVTAKLPPFIKKGQRIPVTVSALGDSTSLVGGTLLTTPLQGVDMQIYAIAQGGVLVSGINELSSTSQLKKGQSTVGSIIDGAIVEEEVPITFSDQHNITIVMNESNFITVSRATQAIQENGFLGAKAIDANTIKIPLTDLNSSDLVRTIANIENILLVPDASAKIVINAKTGTIVIGEMVRLFPVALTHGGLSIRINDDQGGFAGAQGVDSEVISMDQEQSQLLYLNPVDTLSSLVNALNQIGATPKDLISIIEALKESGSLIADIEVI